MDEFWHATLLMLLGCRDLALISVWHPSYLLLLVEKLGDRWSTLIDDLGRGYSGSMAALCQAPDRRRAGQLAGLDPGDVRAIWPGLRLISCWGDAHAGAAITELRRCFPGVTVQPKGLIATEAFVTLPFAGLRPLAIRSHFFEFLDDNGHAHPGWSLRHGESYSLVITTGGGLYRYRLRDRVEVTGFLGATPSLRFVGKEDNVSDHFGEKLDERFVAHCQATIFEALDLAPRFAMLALEEDRPGYALYLESPGADTRELARRLEQQLCRNPHYELCVRLGQLQPVRVVEVAEDAYQAYSAHLREHGARLGDIKPSPLSRYCDWSQVFP